MLISPGTINLNGDADEQALALAEHLENFNKFRGRYQMTIAFASGPDASLRERVEDAILGWAATFCANRFPLHIARALRASVAASVAKKMQ
jgi:hypothetical protein